ncbi:hypothetical protein N7456_007722 [Penicillium angulare]|uniref:N-acetyltransferase domain-containing protein n=1 Tax=Penicillium angulare TaxID=116970 RepID=A0A9W9FBC6_9EURO|nr:hypothetical protein N7456_007722 [Penicillium angulare]
MIRALPEHVPAIQAMIDAAYSKYIERIGKPPAPMLANYDEVIQTRDVFVLRNETQEIVGAIVLSVNVDTHSVEVINLVVGPATQGRGYGRVLLECAEQVAQSQHCPVLTLYTNEKMYENLGMYVKMGFAETGRRTEDGFERVYFRKELS